MDSGERSVQQQVSGKVQEAFTYLLQAQARDGAHFLDDLDLGSCIEARQLQVELRLLFLLLFLRGRVSSSPTATATSCMSPT